MITDSDAQARAQALDVRESVLVQAPAGSGKTTVLVCRYLELLTVVDSPTEILAITFTRKAAAEMRRRVVQALAAAARHELGGKPEDAPAAKAWQRAEEQGWQLLEQPGILRIQTLDALNLELAGGSPLQSGQGFALRIAPDSLAAYRQAARHALRAGAQSGAARNAVKLLLQRLDNRWTALEQLIADLLARRAHWLPHVVVPDDRELADFVQQGLHELLVQRLSAIGTALGMELALAGADHALQAARQLGDEVAAAALPRLVEALHQRPSQALHGPGQHSDPALLPAWRSLARLALTKGGELRRRLDVRDGYPPQPAAAKAAALEWLARVGESPAAIAALGEAAILPAAGLDDDTREALLALWALLRQAAAELSHDFALRGCADFTAIAAAARAALVEQQGPTDLALHVSARLRHILVDEFQDTSLEQIGLLRALTSGWQSGDGRTLFCVGDAMQSIYRFRDAEVGLFLHARQHGVGGLQFKAVALRRNFRSGPAIVDWVNNTLGQLFPTADDSLSSAVSYLPAVSARPEIDASVCLHARIGRDDDAEAAAVVDVVRAARERDPGCGIAVLVQSREHALALVPALAAAGFGVRTVRLTPLAERPAASDLLSLARSLAHPADSPAWLALLRSPLVGLPLASLARLVDAAEATATTLQAVIFANSAPDLTADDGVRVQRLAVALRPAVAGEERGLPLAQRAQRCWLRLGGPALYDSDGELAEVATLLAGLEAQPASDLATGLALPELLAEVRATSNGDPGAIDVLTMHAAKGLEWPVVIVPGLGRRPRAPGTPLLNWLEFPTTHGNALLMAPGGSAHPRSGELLRYLRQVEAQRLRNELLRLMYVAATRAERELHLFAHATLNAEDVAAPDSQSLLATLWPAVRGQFDGLRAERSSQPQGRAAPARLRRLPAEWRAQGALRSPISPSTRSRPLVPLEPIYTGGDEIARAVGTMVHEELQWLASLVELPPADRDWITERNLVARLRDAGLGISASDEAASRVSAAIARTLADPKGRWLLDGAQRESACELALSGVHEGEWIDIVIDRTFIDAEGRRWVIDYKTAAADDEVARGQSEPRQYLAAQRQAYAPQLRRYGTLAAMLGPEPVRCALYFPLLGAFNELT